MIKDYKKKVNQLRAKRGLTWAELGEKMTEARRKRLGPDVPIVGRQGAWMAAKAQNPQATTIHDMADALGVEVGYFFGEGD